MGVRDRFQLPRHHVCLFVLFFCSEGSEDEGDEEMDVEMSKLSEEAAHALAAAKALSQNKGDGSSNNFQDVTDALGELDMEHYDDEDEGIIIFFNFLCF